MAQVILRAVDNDGAGTNPWTYQRGDVVDVLEDGVHAGVKMMEPGEPWNGKPALGWWFIDVAGTAAATVSDLLDAAFDPVTGAPIARRVQKLDYNTLNTPTKRKLDQDRRLAVTETQLRNFLTPR